MNAATDDIRYSELRFLESFRGWDRAIAPSNNDEAQSIGLRDFTLYVELILTLLEDLYVELRDAQWQTLVYRLRNEVTVDFKPHSICDQHWHFPRTALTSALLNGSAGPQLRITYRGLRRIEELRDVLRRERTLDDFGILLSLRYLERDLEYAVNRRLESPVSVIRVDMDGFKAVNDTFGHAAGDVVMRRYLQCVSEVIGAKGDAYRGSGDEVVVIGAGLGHADALALAERLRHAIAAMTCTYEGTALPAVTASIGVATSPPDQRSRDLDTIADSRQRRAKELGKNQVVGS
jgi:diguanylate cyclase (GGDEF)-like protein